MENAIMHGKIGDIVYCMPVLRAIADRTQEPVNVVLQECGGGNWRLSERNINSLYPLVCHQEYVASIEINPTVIPNRRLDFRNWFRFRHDRAHNLCKSALDFANEFLPNANLSRDFITHPWLEVEPRESELTLIHWTERYPAADRDEVWRSMLEDTQIAEARFVGLDDECQRFCEFIGEDVERIEIMDLHDMAQHLTGCRRLICNQSAPHAIATGLGVPVRVETSQRIRDCVFLRKDAEYFGISDEEKEEFGLSWSTSAEAE